MEFFWKGVVWPKGQSATFSWRSGSHPDSGSRFLDLNRDPDSGF